MSDYWFDSTFKSDLARKLSIISSDGTETSLGTYDLFAHDPKGFGLSMKNTIQQVGTALYLADSTYSMDNISFKVIFGSQSRTPYQNYLEFAKIFKGGVVVLKYMIPGVGVYYRDVVLKSITKTEMTKDGVLDETFTFEPLSLWYQIAEESVEISDIYYNYAININIDSNNIFETNFKNNLEITLSADNVSNWAPYWTWMKNGIVYGDGYNIEMQPGDTIIVGNASDNATIAQLRRPSDGTVYDILPYEIDRGVLPVHITDGSNFVTIASNNHNMTVKLIVKVESALI